MPVTLYEPTDRRVEGIWRQLEAMARPPYFQTWGWIETWLASTGADAPPLAVLHDPDGQLAAACFVTAHRARRGLRAHTALHVDAFGGERGGLVRAPGARLAFEELVEALPAGDELVLPAIDRATLPELARLAPTYRVHVERQARARYVDLDSVRAAAGGYAALVEPATRVQLQHARRELGELTLAVAHDVREAHAFLDELLRLQGDVGEHPRGPFAEARAVDVHRQLIARRFAHGEIQLLRIGAEAGTLGVLYAFASHDRLLAYGGGFAALADPHVQPAFVCHAAAIEHAAARGLAFYDLHGADPASQRHLAIGATELAWVRLARPGLRERVAARLREVRRTVARRVGPLPIGA